MGEIDADTVMTARKEATAAEERAAEADRLLTATRTAVEKTKAQQRTVEQRAREETVPEVRRAHRRAVARLAERLDDAAEAAAEVDRVYAHARNQFRPREGRPTGDKIPTGGGVWAEATHPWRALDPKGPPGAWHTYADRYIERED